MEKIFKTKTRDGIKNVEGKLYEYEDIKYFIYKIAEKGYKWCSVELNTGFSIATHKTIKECVLETNNRIIKAYKYIKAIIDETVNNNEQINNV